MICIIPARKNSKGLKNKNIKKLKGIPLIKYSIELARKSKQIEKVYISTDDMRIIKMFKNDKFVEIPFVRPNYLSRDDTSSINVYLHMINFLEQKIKFNDFCVLLPTCPIRRPEEIDKAINIFKKKNLKFLISTIETKPLEFQFKINSNGFMKKINKINFSTANRQELDKIFTPNGSIYIFNKNEFKKKKTFMTDQTYCFKMNKYYSQDIDDIIDFNIVEKLID